MEVAKNNRELTRKRILKGRSVLKGLLDFKSLRDERSTGKLHCTLVEVDYLERVAAGTVYASNVHAVKVAFQARLQEARVARKDKDARAFEALVEARGGGLLARRVVVR